MSSQKLTIINEQVRNRAELIVHGLPVDGTKVVTISDYKRNRSAEQNAYMWRILTIIGNELGNTKDEQHEIYKKMFLVPIFTRDDPGFADMIATVQSLNDVQYSVMSREVVRLTSTTQASVKQMSEYLDDISHHATILGIRLPAEER